MERSSGVLMHITSLPGNFGIGRFGEQAIRFAKFIKACGFSYWQVLPFGPVGYGNSPYQCYCAFAGYHAMIDPKELVKDGLLYEYELKVFDYNGGNYTVDYEFANLKSLDMMQFAYTRITQELRDEINLFALKNSEWLIDYALFMSLKTKFDQKPFWEWPDKGLIKRDKTAINDAMITERESIEFWKFIQFIFFRQWERTKKEINDIGIQIIGDMPIYVSRDSSDLWASPDLFKVDENLCPTVVAGVPPDYFSVDGQLWGNPIYDWDKMEQEDYAWWIRRIASAKDLFDWVRIDHFRGFESYWEVPANDLTAIGGVWRNGPGMKLFNMVSKVLGDVNIIAEDLGDVNDDVRAFLKESRFPGMKVLQFAFGDDTDNEYLPHNHIPNCVAYTGTHDNNTTLGWLWEAGEEERAYILEYCGFTAPNWGNGGSYSESIKAIIRTLWQSCAMLTIIPIQDICGFGSDARMNIPGTLSDNWKFRITSEAIDTIPVKSWCEFNCTFKRTKSSQNTEGYVKGQSAGFDDELLSLHNLLDDIEY